MSKTFGGKYIYYHISPGCNVDPILEEGLIPNKGKVYLADTIWSCEALAPIFNSICYHQQHAKTRSMCFQRKTVYSAYAVFRVNMEGLEDDLRPEPVSLKFFVEKYSGYYTQYIYDGVITPDRISLEYKGLLQAEILEGEKLEGLGFYDRTHFNIDEYRITPVG